MAEKTPETKIRSKSLPTKKRVIVEKILHSPHMTEKTSSLTEQGKYVFRVFKSANKPEVKKAIEDLYKVKVIQVNIVNLPSKKRSLGRFKGIMPGYKKAIVTLAKDQKIESLT